MNKVHFKSGDLCWICIWNEDKQKFCKVCGTIVQYINDKNISVLAGSRIFKRNINEINEFENKCGFLPWPFNHSEINY